MAVVTTGIDKLLEELAEYLGPERLAAVEEAYRFSARQHGGQVRKSGEPFIEHPLRTALLLAELRLDPATVIAALLHDVMEDCGVSFEEMETRFGTEVARLADGVTKLTRIERSSPGSDDGHTQAESLRKMLVAMAEDIRVVLIKLADRLHNMQTLHALSPKRREVVSRETLDIYTPLAHRLGMSEMKWRLEDLAFRYLEPGKYRKISRLLATKREEREAHVNGIVQRLEESLANENVSAEVAGRPKHIYSIHRKMENYAEQGKELSQIYDLYALRILVHTQADCYNALGVVHNLWRPLPGQFDDYIANAKENMYQSLHTAVMCDGGVPLEVQIRTYEMHRVAEYGVAAAHWRYKEGGTPDMQFEQKMTWLRQLLEWQRDVTGAEEFMESVKTDIFPDQVFVYTPKGDIKELPAGATPLDFAFRIHTDLGLRCIGTKVNGKLVPLDYQLNNGDTVEILSSKSARGPSLDWLNSELGYVRTASARAKIRQWFRRQNRAANIQRGKELLHKELSRLDMTAEEAEIAKLFKYDSADELHLALGSGGLTINQVLSRLTAQPEKLPLVHKPPKDGAGVDTGIKVLGVGDLLTHIAACCRPIPGDEIIGYITRGRGITVHKKKCPNILHEDEKERLVELEWGTTERLYPVPVNIVAWDRVGLLRDISILVSAEGVNMSGFASRHMSDGRVTISVTLYTKGIGQLSRMFGKVEAVRGVIGVSRNTSEASSSSHD